VESRWPKPGFAYLEGKNAEAARSRSRGASTTEAHLRPPRAVAARWRKKSKEKDTAGPGARELGSSGATETEPGLSIG
jgi:hypothetical protein